MGKKYKAGETVMAALFFTGFLGGILFVNLWGNTYLRENTILNTENLRLLCAAQIDLRELFFFLLFRRGKLFLLFWLLGYTAAGIPAVLMLLAWLGFSAGTFLSFFISRLRMMGVLLFLAGVMPHALFYVPMVWLMAKGIWQRGVQRFRGRRAAEDWQTEKPYVRTMLFCAALLLLGIAAEGCAGSWLLKQAVNYFL